MSTIRFDVPGIEVFDNIRDEQTGEPIFLFRNLQERYLATIKFSPFLPYDVILANIDKIRSLLFNRVMFEDRVYQTEEEFIAFLDRNVPKYTPEEKLKNVLKFVSSLTAFDGQSIDLNFKKDIEDTQIWRKWYFRNIDEFKFYIENLRHQRLIEYDGTTDSYIGLRLTLDGLTSLIEIEKEANSRYCFVAMSFDEKLKSIYTEGILPALNATGYLPFILTERQVDADRTINDEIIAGLKQAHFTIAEFTQHRHGVYFEAGYALGRGQKVIYLCSKDDFGQAHFDTNHFQHIIWANTEDLKKQLIDKINAFITD